MRIRCNLTSIKIALLRDERQYVPTQKNLTFAEAKQIVAEALAKHGDEWDLRPLLDSLPPEKRPMVARMFSEMRRQGAIETTLEVDTATGEVKHTVRKGKANTP